MTGAEMTALDKNQSPQITLKVSIVAFRCFFFKAKYIHSFIFIDLCPRV